METIPVFDGHNDTLLKICLPAFREGRTFFERSEVGHLDLPRAREGGFGGGIFACWTPPDPESSWTEESALTRTEDGYEVANIGARLIPLAELPERLVELDRDETLAVHCKTGGRSARAVRLLKNSGFQNVYNVKGGIDAWSEEIDPSVPKY